MRELPTSDFHKMSVGELDTTQLLANAARQRDQKKFDEFPIIDVDRHHYEHESIREIIEYLEDPVLKHAAKMETGGSPHPTTFLLPSFVGQQGLAGRITRYPLRRTEEVDAAGPHRDIQIL